MFSQPKAHIFAVSIPNLAFNIETSPTMSRSQFQARCCSCRLQSQAICKVTKLLITRRHILQGVNIRFRQSGFSAMRVIRVLLLTSAALCGIYVSQMDIYKAKTHKKQKTTLKVKQNTSTNEEIRKIAHTLHH